MVSRFTVQETGMQSGTGDMEKRVAATPASIGMLRKEGYNVAARRVKGVLGVQVWQSTSIYGFRPWRWLRPSKPGI